MFPIIPANSVAADSGNQEGIFGYGEYNVLPPMQSMTNLISNVGVASTDVTGVGTARHGLAACSYGGDKGIFGYGSTYVAPTGSNQSMTNLVSNAGVVATDTTGVGTARCSLAACEYGDDKGIFGFGSTGNGHPGAIFQSMTNLVSNAGVVATDVTGVGTARYLLAATQYGGDKGIFGYGRDGTGNLSMTNLVSNAGVVATDVTGVGTARYCPAACSYGGDKGIFGYGFTTVNVSMTNLVSNAGVVASDVTGVGQTRNGLAACRYGGDKGIFGYGYMLTGNASMTNLVSNAGVVATDVTGVGTARANLAACSFN